ncbi:MAG TPA: hypothetical protein VIG32_10775 [Candidatus Baltobacteraceae bacterium]|jgi:hypothetical protein
MPLSPDQEKAAATKYLDIVAKDPAARERFIDLKQGDEKLVAAEISKTVGMEVHPENLRGMATHLYAHHSEAVEKLHHEFPAMASFVLEDI